MTSRVSDDLLSLLAEFVSNRMGIHFPKERWGDLEHGISSAASEFGYKDVETCIKWLISSRLTKMEVDILASYLTIGETYFFREKRSFEILRDHILPELIYFRRKNEKYIRIWSAGCATGEEPYSIAILLHKIIPDIEEWNITILATDINLRFLQKAQKGIFTDWSFRDAPDWINNYFRKKHEGFEIFPKIKKMVTFSYHNLAEDTYPSLLNNTNAMDIIFCRNVMIYFSQKRTKQVVTALYHCLVDGGWLVVSPVETSHILFSKYITVNFPEAILYKKEVSKMETFEKLIPEVIIPEPSLISIPEEERESVLILSSPVELKPYDEALKLYERGNYSQAVEKLFKLFGRDPDARAMILLARAYANQGKLEEAQKWCERAIISDRLNPGGYYLRAVILQEQGEFGEAAKYLKRAIYLDQDFALAHFGLGNLYTHQGKKKDAAKYFDNALIILKKIPKDEILPESEGITAGRLSEIIISMKKNEESI